MADPQFDSMPKIRMLILACLTGIWLGCAGTASDELPASYIRVHLDKSNPEQLLEYYFGGYVSPEPSDPFEAGIVEEVSGRLYVNIDSLEHHYPGAVSLLVDANRNDRIDWDEFEQFVEETYYRARSLPQTLAELREAIDFDSTSTDWMNVEIDGVMTTARRSIFIRESAVVEALQNYWNNGEQIIYPIGTTILGFHVVDRRKAETTVMQKREDGYWDFMVYADNDTLGSSTSTPPKPLRSPVQCVGCHFGNKLFEPEKSFPATAQPGPHGPRRVYVDDSMRNETIVTFFDEHRKRSDTILGLYGTLFVAQLEAGRRAGTLPDAHLELLERLHL